MNGNDDLGEFERLLRALEPILDRLLIIGGWAHRLYRFDNVVVPPYDAIHTTDTDVAVARDAVDANTILKRLHLSGFVAEFRGEDRPPITHYHLGGASSGYYVEFLTPLARSRRKQDTVVIGGIVAQALPHLDIVMIEPWSVKVPASNGDLVVNIPNPVSYIAQKLVVMKDRAVQDRAKDILYIHDTIELYAARLDELCAMWREKVHPVIDAGNAVMLPLVKKYFSEVTDDIRRAARIQPGRRLEPEELRARGEGGLVRIFCDSPPA